MNETIQQLITACQWDTVSFFILSKNVFDPFIYYSHLLPLVTSLSLGIFLFVKGKKQLAPKILFVTILFLAVWLLGDLITWATNKPFVTMFFWSIINMVEPLIYAGILYFLYVFIDQKDIAFYRKLIIAFLVLPTIVLSFIHFGLTSYNLTTCDRDAIEGPLANYGYLIESIFILWGLIMVIKRFIINKSPVTRRQIVLISIGSLGFLAAFAFGNIIGTWFSDLNILGSDYSWSIGQYGIFGVPLFIAFLSYILVAYKSFNTKVFGGQILVGGLVIIIASEFFFVKTLANIILTAITLFISIIFGLLLIKSIKKEIKNREHIEKLAAELETANSGQETFIHFLSHEIKGYLTISRNGFSSIVEGDYGNTVPLPLTTMAKDALQRMTEGVDVVENILKSSNLKSGKVVYTMAPFDIRQAVLAIARMVAQNVKNRGLTLDVHTDESADYTIVGDQENITRHVIKNLVDNAINYTPEGKIEISLEKKAKTILFSVKDSGVGITAEDKLKLFKEGGRGTNSVKTNAHSTGYGLFIAKGIVVAHKGKIWAESEGQDKGTTFFVELPVK